MLVWPVQGRDRQFTKILVQRQIVSGRATPVRGWGDYTLNIADKTYVSQPLFQALQARIISGEYPPGTLLSEKKLTREFHVSRTPYREALRQLANLKLVTVVPRFGTYVSQVNITEVLDAYEVRTRLEVMAAELAAARRTPFDLDRLKALVEEILNADDGDPAALAILDTQIHDHIYQCSGNLVLAESLDSLGITCRRIWTSSLRRNHDTGGIKTQWKEILAAIAAQNDAKAGQGMQVHMRCAVDLIKANIFF